MAKLGVNYAQYDQLAELEWLSNYMGEGDDAFATEDLQKLKLISGGYSPAVNVAPAPVAPAAAAQPGAGAVVVDGEMVDRPVLERALSVLARRP